MERYFYHVCRIVYLLGKRCVSNKLDCRQFMFGEFVHVESDRVFTPFYHVGIADL